METRGAFYFLGIDISKETFDVCVIDGKCNILHTAKIDNTKKAIQSFYSELKKKLKITPHNVVACMEHTGVYCIPLLEFLHGKEIAVCIEPALQIKNSQGMTRGKNDTIDANRIATYAAKNLATLRYWAPPRLVVQKLKALMTLRKRLMKAKNLMSVPLNEASGFLGKEVLKELWLSCKPVLTATTTGLEMVDNQIAELIASDASLKQQMRFATSTPGIGKVTATMIIVATDEFKKIKEPKKFACYSGVAPFEHSSGSSVRGKTRVSKMANMEVKKVLHMAAMSAIQHCDELKAFYERKVGKGKNKMSVINAVRNKLITRVFACVLNERMYEKNYARAVA